MCVDHAFRYVPRILQRIVSFVAREPHRINSRPGRSECAHCVQPQSATPENHRENYSNQSDSREHNRKMVDENMYVWPGQPRSSHWINMNRAASDGTSQTIIVRFHRQL